MNTFSFFYAYRNTTIANAILTHYTAPLFVAFLAPLLLRERLTARILLSVAIATVGLWVLLGLSPGRLAGLAAAGDREVGGILAGLFSGLAYALLVIVSRLFARNTHPLVMTFFQNIVIVFLLLPFAGILKVAPPPLWTMAVMGIVHSTIAPVLYFRGLKEVAANRAALLGYLEPVCAIVLGALFLGEGLQPASALGGAVILFSGYLAMREPS
jgi:drug/metabolite transporter (DMT)-like permease